MLLSMSTAVCERGFSLMYGIKFKNRSRMTNNLLGNLMNISSNGESLEHFDPQLSVNEWSSQVCHRPGQRKEKSSTTNEEL